MIDDKLIEFAKQLKTNGSLTNGQRALQLVERAAELHGLDKSKPFGRRANSFDAGVVASAAGFPESILSTCRSLYSKVRRGDASPDLEQSVRDGKCSPNTAYQASTKPPKAPRTTKRSSGLRSSPPSIPANGASVANNLNAVRELLQTSRDSVDESSRVKRLNSVVLSIGCTIAHVSTAIAVSQSDPSLRHFLEKSRLALQQLHTETLKRLSDNTGINP